MKVESAPEVVWATQALAEALKGVRDPRERGLATELVYGVLRWQGRIDYSLAAMVRQGLGRLEPVAKVLLRLGVYQIGWLDKIPAPIAVSATQDAARELGAGRITGLLNGVLRRLAREGERPIEGHDARALAVRSSLPQWIVRELQAVYGEDAEAEALALRERARTTVRPTLAKGGASALSTALAEEGFQASEGPSGTSIIEGPGDPFATRAFLEGFFVPQDPASLRVVDALGEVAGKRVLDLCAGRGIKATALLDRGAEVLATDKGGAKLNQARALAKRLGVDARLTTKVADATDEALALGRFDVVLVDAPCSGLGTLRRHPEIAWRTAPDAPASMAAIQRRLLATGARHVAPGGLLAYAVCTFTKVEGEVADPEGFERVERLVTRPSEGEDAFQAALWRRGGAPE